MNNDIDMEDAENGSESVVILDAGAQYGKVCEVCISTYSQLYCIF